MTIAIIITLVILLIYLLMVIRFKMIKIYKCNKQITELESKLSIIFEYNQIILKQQISLSVKLKTQTDANVGLLGIIDKIKSINKDLITQNDNLLKSVNDLVVENDALTQKYNQIKNKTKDKIKT